MTQKNAGYVTETVMRYEKLCKLKGENAMKQKYGIMSLVIMTTAWCITKKQKYRTLAVIGMVLALPFVLWGILWGINCMNGMSIEEGVRVFLEGAEQNL